jgi:tetratricopeptide (TPR) repeat protein
MAVASFGVRAWSERIIIPTYTVGEPDRNPVFLEKRVYQGSSGVVYPHPVIDRIIGERVERDYTAVFLENAYLKIMILPKLGGRVQMALDKTNGYHFVYHNRVIKPALVGLCGPWISGGIEFNWPQHHRPSTFQSVDWTIEESPDRRTVWCSEVEQMFRTQGRHGFTLYPDRAYLEVQVRLINRTEEPQTFLWWANPAVHVHERYQSVFPPDVHAVMDHGKRAVSDFPIATGTYYKVNYAPGTDISRYSTIPVPTSYMAYHSDYDFLGCYDHNARAGLLHVADHHIVPGKKQWTWGNGDFGWAWDRQLTDEDGPYIELMCGAFTDNQPDFSWIMPGEEKSFSQVFFPYKQIGPPKNASREAAVNLELEGESARIGVYVTSPRDVTIRLLRQGETLFETTTALTPETAFTGSVSLPRGTQGPELRLEVLSGHETLVEFIPPSEEGPPIPELAAAARPPREIGSVEELFLNGLHLEQYRHATYAPEPYYEEALRRDPGDSRCNTAMGRRLLHCGKFREAEPYFRRAIARLTHRNPNPYDGEPYYHLGRCLRYQGRDAEAYDAFAKATWNDAWKGAASFQLARIDSRRRDVARALEHLGPPYNFAFRSHDAQVRHLRAALYRRMGRMDKARQDVSYSLAVDDLDLGARFEGQKLGLRAHPEVHFDAGGHRALELALDYAHAGLFEEAGEVIRGVFGAEPTAPYYAAWFCAQAGDETGARATLDEAVALSPDCFFPNQVECVPALETALRLRPEDWKAAYGLGNFWYAHRQYEDAIACWERCRSINPAFPTAIRNLGLAYFNKRGDTDKALDAFETAFALDPTDARVFFELDQLHRRLNHPPEARLARLEACRDLVERRDDLTIERVTLKNATGRHDEALAILLGRTFHPWEGGEGKPTGQYVEALIGLARAHLRAGRPDEAVACLVRARTYPANLGEGKLPGARENHVLYWLGCAHRARGEEAQARQSWEEASAGLAEPSEALYYNDQPPEMIFYQGLALRALGREDEARRRFETLRAFGQARLEKPATIDYFAVSLPDFLVFDDDLERRSHIHGHYLTALGDVGLGRLDEAARAFDRVLELDRSHFGSLVHRGLVGSAEWDGSLRA